MCNIFCRAQLCTNYYFSPNLFFEKGDNSLFPLSIVKTTNEVYHPWFLSSHCDFLYILSSNFWFFDIRNAFQRVTSVVRLLRSDSYSRCRGFKVLYIIAIYFNFYKPMRFIQVNAIVHFLSLVNALLVRSTYLSCAYQWGPSRGWLLRRIILPSFYTRILAQLAPAHYWYFLFYKVHSQTP